MNVNFENAIPDRVIHADWEATLEDGTVINGSLVDLDTGVELDWEIPTDLENDYEEIESGVLAAWIKTDHYIDKLAQFNNGDGQNALEIAIRAIELQVEGIAATFEEGDDLEIERHNRAIEALKILKA